MLFPYADKNTPFVLSPESLDWHLGKGWYRMGGHIFTTHFLFFQEQPYSAIWIRVDLQNFQFSKRQRKLLRRNAKLFELGSGPRVIDTERENLYVRYAADFDGRISPTIADSLEDYEGKASLFNTWETTVRDKVSGQLVGVSYFDLGDQAAASILGVYDPLLKSFSLGYYTMLLEIQYCIDNGMRYYYPGYVVPGYQRFDYKLRLGNSEYFDLRTDSWIAYDQEDINHNGPTESQRRWLALLTDQLSSINEKHPGVFIYPLFEAGLYDMWNEDYLPYPYFYPLGKDTAGDVLLVTFDPKDQEYLVLQCFHKAEAQLMFNAAYLNGFSQKNFFTDLLSVRNVLFRTSHPEVIIRACRGLLTGADDSTP
jgi:arginine-tRNA-protein transferase